ncbi:two component transcriptional regulator LuxR family [Candidatus Gastranaerophilus sp. (ex Termes propinquus)]|nr:two component transcriptional regulator LuxR family [Candidatus Gastranaerophilus sp. (ex Termes propinquus)]
MTSLGNILIVDDNPKLIADALPMYGYTVSSATDGLIALKMLNEEGAHYDLILLDVMMPNLNGWDTLKAIRQNPALKGIPIIMLTAVDEDVQQISGLKFGADDYITKPFILPNLLARIEALLRRASWGKQEKTATPLPFVSKSPILPLTAREKEILKLVAKGASNSEIAEKLVVREVTVKTHLSSIYKKLNVESRVQAVLLSMQTNIIE